MQSMYLPGERIAVQAHLNYAPSSSCNVWKDMLTLPSDLSSSTTRWGRPPRPLQLTIVNVTPNSGESCPFSDTFISTEVINDGSSNAKEKQRKDTRFFVPAKPVWNSLMRTKTVKLQTLIAWLLVCRACCSSSYPQQSLRCLAACTCVYLK